MYDVKLNVNDNKTNYYNPILPAIQKSENQKTLEYVFPDFIQTSIISIRNEIES